MGLQSGTITPGGGIGSAFGAKPGQNLYAMTGTANPWGGSSVAAPTGSAYGGPYNPTSNSGPVGGIYSAPFWGGGAAGTPGSGTGGGNTPGGTPDNSAPNGKGGGSFGGNPYANDTWQNPLQQPLNNLIGASSSMANMFGGMLPQIGGAFQQLFNPNATDIEANLLKQASGEASNQLSAKYGDIPGHAGYATELGQQMANVGAQLAQARTNQILPGMQAAVGNYMQGSQIPLTAATSALQQGQATALAPLQSIMGVYQGAPYTPPVYQSGGGGGKK